MRSTILGVPLVLLAGCLSLESDMEKEKRQSVLFPAEMVGFLVTQDAVRCREFFVEKLGFGVVGEDEHALVLEADGRMLRVQKGPTHEPRRFTVLGWNVPDIEAAVTRLGEAGVSCEGFGLPGQDARGIMTFPDGARVAWLKDPDGNVLSLAQLPAAGAAHVPADGRTRARR